MTIPLWFAALVPMLSVTHMVVVLNTGIDAKTVSGHFALTRFFPDTSVTFSKIPDISVTAVVLYHFQDI